MIYKTDKTYAAKQFSDYPIATDTAISLGMPVSLSAGKVVAATASGASQVFLGIAGEDHAASDTALGLKCRRTKIAVIDSPTAVYAAKGIKITATADSTNNTEFTVAANSFGADDYNGGKAKCVKAGTGSSLVVGTVYDIGDTTTSILKLTDTTTIKSGDEVVVYPQLGCTKIGFAVSSSVLTGEFTLNTAGVTVKVVSVDTDADEICVMKA